MTGFEACEAKIDARLVVPAVRPPKPLISKEGWRAFVDHLPVMSPPRVAASEVASWAPREQKIYARIRKRHHAMLPPLATPELLAVRELVGDLAETGLAMPPGVRPGAVLDGYPTLGKSTIATEIGRSYERALRKRLARLDDRGFCSEFLPVVYATLSANESPKSLFVKLLEFGGHPYSRNDNETRLNTHVANALKENGTSLVIVDDIHFLNPRSSNGRSTNQQLKALGSSSNATFLYVGVDVTRTGLLYDGEKAHEAEAAQTQARFKLLTIKPFARGSKEYVDVLAALEAQLYLLNAKKGDLAGLAGYIHDRTGGLMGATTSLVREAAAVAIDSGAERLTKSLMDQIILDHASEVRARAIAKHGGADATK